MQLHNLHPKTCDPILHHGTLIRTVDWVHLSWLLTRGNQLIWVPNTRQRLELSSPTSNLLSWTVWGMFQTFNSKLYLLISSSHLVLRIRGLGFNKAFQTKIFRKISPAPYYDSNMTLYDDLKILYVRQIITFRYKTFHEFIPDFKMEHWRKPRSCIIFTLTRAIQSSNITCSRLRI